MLTRLRTRVYASLAFLTLVGAAAVAMAAPAAAHPLGNFTVNYYSGITVQPHAIIVDLVVDRAEIPTLQTYPDAAVGRQPSGGDALARTECAALADQARLTVQGAAVTLSLDTSRLEILAGAAGLATSRIECHTRTSTSVDPVGTEVTYQAAPSSGHVGWHEVTARGDGVTLVDSTVPADSPSKQLTAYPQDLLASPLDQNAARFTVRSGSGGAAGASVPGTVLGASGYGLDGLTTAYTDLVSRTSLTPGFALLALVLSMVLGAMHAFAPGHGKTLMAAYLVGREGTWRQAAVIGVSVTVTHTVGVLLLGLALSAAVIAAPEQLYPWLGLISGLLLAGIGVTLLRTARRGHVHGPGGHTHGPEEHTHGPGGHTHGPGGRSYGVDVADPVALGSAAEAYAPSLSTIQTTQRPEHDHEHDHGHDHEHDHEHDHGHGPGHGHGHGHGHDHGLGHDQGHGHGHGHGAAEQQEADRSEAPTRGRRRLSTARLAVVGLVGGMVPSPSALLVLLGGIALGRAWFGAILVVAYGAGMAAALVGTGLLLVAARDRIERWSARRPNRAPGHTQLVVLTWTRRLPFVTATIVIIAGLWIAARSIPGL